MVVGSGVGGAPAPGPALLGCEPHTPQTSLAGKSWTLLGSPKQVLTVGTGRPLVVAWRFAAALRAPRVKGRANSPGIQIAPDAEYLMWGWLPISPPTGHCWSRNRPTKWLGGRTSLDNEG